MDYVFDTELSSYFVFDFEDEQLQQLREAYGDVGMAWWEVDTNVLGLNIMQLMTGACVVGVMGFLSSGFITAMLFGRRDGGMLLFAVAIGLITAFFQVYGEVKSISSKWLQKAESTVLDVGARAKPKPRPHPEPNLSGPASVPAETDGHKPILQPLAQMLERKEVAMDGADHGILPPHSMTEIVEGAGRVEEAELRRRHTVE